MVFNKKSGIPSRMIKKVQRSISMVKKSFETIAALAPIPLKRNDTLNGRENKYN
jgi:hypothetical protein